LSEAPIVGLAPVLPVSVAGGAVSRHRIAYDNALRRVCRQFGHYLAVHLHPVGVAVRVSAQPPIEPALMDCLPMFDGLQKPS
jgi:hypothetical protein